MSAVAGPGPSTMASSPVVPTSAKNLRMKKRVINLVNPADPQEFSGQDFSTSPHPSPDSSINVHSSSEYTTHTAVPTPAFRLTEATQTFTFTPGSTGSAVKGILRSTGTPGSGNGVRFFPKNKLRIITPNASLIAEAASPKPKPPSSPTNSFFSQLLAVTIPVMSPRREPPTPEPVVATVHPDESWEVPGQEGEVSLVASTASVDMTMDSQAEESIREDSWNGEPEQHCSPLSLPSAPDGNTSKDASFSALELPSAEWNLPEDMSNLLSTRFNPEDSSLLDPPSAVVPARESPLHPARTLPSQTRPAAIDFWNAQEQSVMSEGQSEQLDDNPTIRRRLSPNEPRQPVLEPETPTPATHARPLASSSIFADMSAEQADLTWPLTRRDGAEDEEGFHSAILGETPIKLGLATPKSSAGAGTAVGDTTEFFDCTAMILSPPDSSVVIRPTSSVLHQDLVMPTKAFFEAQAAHTSALSAELDLYRSLAQKLQAEVAERDQVLAKLNLRALEAEVLQSQVSDLREELATTRSTRRKSLSPSPAPSPTLRAGQRLGELSDRTMAAQSEAKDLEIRLAKALGDTALMSKQLAEAQTAQSRQEEEMEELRADLRDFQEAERDRLVKNQGKDEDLRALQQELDKAQAHVRQLGEVEDEVQVLRAELDAAQRQLDEVENKEDELHATRMELDAAHRHADDLEGQVETLAACREELETAQKRIEELESQAPPPQDHLEGELSEAQQKISELKKHVDELTQVKVADEEEMDRLMDEVDRLKASTKGRRERDEDLRARVADLERDLEKEGLRREEVERRWREEQEVRKGVEGQVKELRRALGDLQTNFSARAEDVEPLKAEINRLRSESASKDLEIVTLHRRKAELKEDREMLNIALDSKQQELELIKRRFSVKGVAGSTPLASSRKANLDQSTSINANNSIATPAPAPGTAAATATAKLTGATTRRRSSMALQTPVPGNKHGVALHPSTRITNRVMSKVGEENWPPVSGASVGAVRGSMRRREREREMMLA